MRRPRAYKAKPASGFRPSNEGEKQAVRRATEIGLTERHVQETVTAFLQRDGWRAIRTEAQSDRGFIKRVLAKASQHTLFHALVAPLSNLLLACMRAAGVGEVGMPDYLYVRYANPCRGEGCSGENCGGVEAEVLWCEFKAPGKKPSPHQLAWHEAERARGALVLVVSDIDNFMTRLYPQSGLQRR